MMQPTFRGAEHDLEEVRLTIGRAAAAPRGAHAALAASVDVGAPRGIAWLHSTYRKPVWLAETKVDQAERYSWLIALKAALATAPWVKAVIWSETTSRGQASGQSGTGNMDWSLTTDAGARKDLAAALGA